MTWRLILITVFATAAATSGCGGDENAERSNNAVSHIASANDEEEVCVGPFEVKTRAELEALSHCTEITGNLRVTANDVNDLAPLSRLTRVGGVLTLSTGSGLRSLHGLEALTHVGSLWIENNTALSSLDALSALREVGDFQVSGNALVEWVGPSSLTHVGALSISHESLLERVAGFSGITEIAGRVQVRGNFELEEFSALPALTRIGGYLEFRHNLILETVADFPNLREVGGVSLAWNDKMTHFTALQQVTVAHGNVNIEYMPKLAELDFAGLKIIDGTLIFYGPLPVLTSLKGFRSVANVGSLSVIGQVGFANLRGLDQLTAIAHALTIEKTSALVELTGLENVTTASYLNINQTRLRNLRGLAKLSLVTNGTIAIQRNDEMTEIGALDTTTQARRITVYNNLVLTELNGLRGLRSAERIEIGINWAMKHINGLNALEYVKEGLWLYQNSVLASIDELSALTKVDGIVSFNRNNSLRDLSGFRSLTSVGGRFDILDCGRLSNLVGLEALQSIGGNLSISGNARLTEMDELAHLPHLGGNFTVTDNPTLPECQPRLVVEQLVTRGYDGVVDIRNNGGTGTCN